MKGQRTFSSELESQPVDVPRAVLYLAQEIAYPDLDVEHYLERLDELALAAQEEVSLFSVVEDQAEALSRFLFKTDGFRGNTVEYTDPRNSFLNDVIDRRLGIPITLSVLYVAAAERLGLPARGVGMPGHFIVRVDAPSGAIFLDPFFGGERLTIQDCSERVQHSTGYQGEFQMSWLDPSPPHEILGRVLNNLWLIYVQQEDWSAARKVMERLHLIYPDSPDTLRNLGFVHFQAGSLRQAVALMEQYLVRHPDAPDAHLVQQNLQQAAQRLARLN